MREFFAFVGEGAFGEGENLESLGVGDEIFAWCDLENGGLDFRSGEKVAGGDAADHFCVSEKGDLKR